VREPEEKRPFGKHRRGLEGKVKIYLGFDGVEYIFEALGRSKEQSLKTPW